MLNIDWCRIPKFGMSEALYNGMNVRFWKGQQSFNQETSLTLVRKPINSWICYFTYIYLKSLKSSNIQTFKNHSKSHKIKQNFKYYFKSNKVYKFLNSPKLFKILYTILMIHNFNDICSSFLEFLKKITLFINSNINFMLKSTSIIIKPSLIKTSHFIIQKLNNFNIICLPSP